MEQWKILVLGVVRLGLNADYDRLQELANEHRTLRRMLGHGDWDEDYEYEVQTLKDNLALFTPEVLDRINQVVVGAGHVLVKKTARKACADAVIPSWWRPTSIFRPTSACSTTRFARPCGAAGTWGWKDGGSTGTC
jgi:hypothetical protein